MTNEERFKRDEAAQMYETRLKAKLIGIYYSIRENGCDESLDLSRFSAIETIPIIEKYIQYQRNYIEALKKEVRELKQQTK